MHYISKKFLLEGNDLKFGYEKDKVLIDKLSFKIGLKDKICIIGKNGKGKSTLLKLITNNISPTEGNIKINPKTEIGYFGQMNIDRLDPKLSVYEEMQEFVPTMSQTDVRKTCGNMMFSGSLSNKKITQF